MFVRRFAFGAAVAAVMAINACSTRADTITLPTAGTVVPADSADARHHIIENNRPQTDVVGPVAPHM
jgi:hypothetical protein